MTGESNNWCFVVVLLCLLRNTVNSYIEVGPVDTEVLVGVSTYLNCSSSTASAEISWFSYPVGKGTEYLRYVFVNGEMFKPYDNRFRIDKDSSAGAFNLVMNRVENQDAGQYICQNNGNKVTAQLIIIETYPQCVSNIDSNGFIGPNSCGLKKQSIELSCSVSYMGNILPQLKWKRVKNSHSFPVDDSLVSCSVSNSHITCNYTSDADVEMDGSSFICQTNRATNSQYSCSTETVKVHYAADNRTWIERNVGEAVTCYANTSSTDCKYRWIFYEGDRQDTISENRTLIISREGLHRCEAICRIKEFECTVNALTTKAYAVTDVTVVPENESTTITLRIFTVLLACLSVSLIVAIFVMHLKIKKALRAAQKRQTERHQLLEKNAETEDQRYRTDLEAKNAELKDKNAEIEFLKEELERLRFQDDARKEASKLCNGSDAEDYGNEAENDETVAMQICRSKQKSRPCDGDEQSRWKCPKCEHSNYSASCEMCNQSRESQSSVE